MIAAIPILVVGCNLGEIEELTEDENLTNNQILKREFGSEASSRGGVLGFKVLCECTVLINLIVFVCEYTYVYYARWHAYVALVSCSNRHSELVCA